jgi:hypothetical protein
VKQGFTVGAAIVMLMTASVAQVNGIPASVTSSRNGNVASFTARGIPSSVSSLGPEGLAFQTRDFRPLGPVRRDRLGRVVLGAAIPLFYDIYAPIVYVRDASGVEPTRIERLDSRSEPQKIIVEIRDTRPAEAPPKEVIVEKKTAPREEAEAARTATVFIFLDGSRKELKDFAITQTELIDLSAGMIRRSPLSTVDRSATLRVNSENGVELYFPASASD